MSVDVGNDLLDRGENHYKSKHLTQFSFLGGTADAVVKASMKNEYRTVQVVFNVDQVSSASCNCPAGSAGRCSHIATVLFYVHMNISSTDVSCKWNERKEDATRGTESIEQMVAREGELPTVPIHECSAEEKVSIRESLKTALQSVNIPLPIKWLLSDEPSDDVNDRSNREMESIIFSKEFEEADDKLAFLLKHCSVDQAEIMDIAENTVGQFDNALFCRLRTLRLTAYKYGDIIASFTKKTVPESLFKSILGVYMKDPKKKPMPIIWGNQNEDNAFDAFTKMIPGVRKIGLILHECGFLGASPDGIAEKFILEMKCPYSARYSNDLRKSLKMPKQKSRRYLVNYDEAKGWIINKDHLYYHQIMAQIYFAKKDFGYFFVWTTKTHMVFTIPKDPTWEENIPKLQRFYVDKFLPYVLEHPEFMDSRLP